jgi:CRP-like cAMP-binding protein
LNRSAQSTSVAGKHCSGKHSDVPVNLGRSADANRSSDQPPHILAMLGPGAIFGEMGPLTDAPRSATCIALTDSHIAELPYSALNAGLERGDRWATKFLIATARVLAQRLAALNKEAISVMAQLEESKSKVSRRR